MEKVTKYNYEAFFLDFYEGNLDAIQSEELLEFLKLNPELKVEFEEFEQIVLPNEILVFDSKEVLFSTDKGFQDSITTDNFESFAIAKLEGLLSDEKLKEYAVFVGNHPELNAIDDKYQATILPTETILFPNQSQLIRKKKSILIYLYTASSAVAAALLIWFYLFNPVQVYDYRTIGTNSEDQVLKEITFISNNKSYSANDKVMSSISKKTPRVKEVKIADKKAANTPVMESADDTPIKIAEQKNEANKPTFSAIEEMEMIQIDELAALENSKSDVVVSKESVQAIKTMHTPMEKLRKEVLNDKPIIEVIADEITAATNEKIKVKAVKGLNRKIEEFALQIGNFGISKKY